MPSNHPLFEKVPASRRWLKSLEALDAELTTEAKEQWKELAGTHEGEKAREAEKDWCWRVLPRGALVAKRIRDDLDSRMELRIARLEQPETPEAEARWEHEISTFLKHFHVRILDGETPCRHPGRDYVRRPNTDADEGKAAVRLLQLRFGECDVGKALCWTHLQEQGEVVVVPWWEAGGVEGQRCQQCAVDQKTEKGEVPV